jgi:hypothetical protein
MTSGRNIKNYKAMIQCRHDIRSIDFTDDGQVKLIKQDMSELTISLAMILDVLKKVIRQCTKIKSSPSKENLELWAKLSSQVPEDMILEALKSLIEKKHANVQLRSIIKTLHTKTQQTDKRIFYVEIDDYDALPLTMQPKPFAIWSRLGITFANKQFIHAKIHPEALTTASSSADSDSTSLIHNVFFQLSDVLPNILSCSRLTKDEMLPVSLVNRRFLVAAQAAKEQAKSTVGKLEDQVLFSAYDLWKKKTIEHRNEEKSKKELREKQPDLQKKLEEQNVELQKLQTALSALEAKKITTHTRNRPAWHAMIPILLLAGITVPAIFLSRYEPIRQRAYDELSAIDTPYPDWANDNYVASCSSAYLCRHGYSMVNGARVTELPEPICKTNDLYPEIIAACLSACAILADQYDGWSASVAVLVFSSVAFCVDTIARAVVRGSPSRWYNHDARAQHDRIDLQIRETQEKLESQEMSVVEITQELESVKQKLQEHDEKDALAHAALGGLKYHRFWTPDDQSEWERIRRKERAEMDRENTSEKEVAPLSHVLTIHDDESDDKKSENKQIHSKATSSASNLISINNLAELREPLLSSASVRMPR